MGAEQSHEVNPDKSQFNSNFSKNYTFVKESMDKRFGEIQIYKKKTDEIYLAKRSKNCEGREDFQTAFKLAQKRKDMKHKNLINLVHFSDSSEDNLCGDFNKITLYHDYYMLDLEKELSRRKENNEYLNENEIWYLLDSLVNVNQYIEKNKLYHGDLKPSTIFLTQEGQVKIADSSILSSQKSAYFKALSGEKCNLSPTLLVALKHKDLLPAHDIHKSDVYSLGMTMLEVADLAPAFHCYNWSTKEIIQSKIDECLERIQTRYGEFFAGILRDMLAEKENNRPTFEDINSVLAPYQETIQDMDQQQNQQNQSQLHNSGHNVQTQSRIVQAPTVLQNSQTYFTPQSQNKIAQVQYQNSPQTQVIYQQQPQLSSSQIQQVSPRSQIVQPQQTYVVQQQQPQQIYTVSTPVRLVQLQEQQQQEQQQQLQQQEQKDQSQSQDRNQQQQQQQYVPQFQQFQGNQQNSYVAQNLVHSKYQNPQ